MEELEELRIKIKNRYLIGFLLTVVIIILICIFFQFTPILFFVIVLGIIFTAIATSTLNRQYRKKFKDFFVLKSLENKFTELFYDPDNGIQYQTIAQTKMMNMGDRYHSEDYISGRYKDIRFEQSDVHIEEEHTSTDSDGHTTTEYVTIFKGRWMIFDFNKTFKADVQISQKGFGNSRVKRFFGKKEELFKKVQMESETFNKISLF